MLWGLGVFWTGPSSMPRPHPLSGALPSRRDRMQSHKAREMGTPRALSCTPRRNVLRAVVRMHRPTRWEFTLRAARVMSDTAHTTRCVTRTACAVPYFSAHARVP